MQGRRHAGKPPATAPQCHLCATPAGISKPKRLEGDGKVRAAASDLKEYTKNVPHLGQARGAPRRHDHHIGSEPLAAAQLHACTGQAAAEAAAGPVMRLAPAARPLLVVGPTQPCTRHASPAAAAAFPRGAASGRSAGRVRCCGRGCTAGPRSTAGPPGPQICPQNAPACPPSTVLVSLLHSRPDTRQPSRTSSRPAFLPSTSSCRVDWMRWRDVPTHCRRVEGAKGKEEQGREWEKRQAGLQSSERRAVRHPGPGAQAAGARCSCAVRRRVAPHCHPQWHAPSHA